MTVSTIFAIGGIALIFVAIVGEFSGNYSIPRMPLLARIAAFAAGAAFLVLAISINSTKPPSGPANATSSTAIPTTSKVRTTTRSSVAANSQVSIISPVGVPQVSVSTGLLVKGNAADLEEDSIWLLDFSPLDKFHGFYQVNDVPIPVVNGKWEFLDAPLGDKSDPKGTIYYVKVLRANQHCANLMSSAKANSDGDVTFKTVPAGCTVVATLKAIKHD